MPLLAWEESAAAEAACTIARSIRKCDVIVSTVGGTHQVPGDQLILYSASHHAQVLAGQLPRERVSSTKTASDWHRTKVFTGAVLELADAPDAACKQAATTKWNKIIHATFAGGSVVSASQFLSGKRAAAIVELLRNGTLVEDDELPIADIERAITIAKADSWNAPTA
ncbi:hypothetical protein SAMN04489711_1474 [Paracidovorax wautersii]|uniref:Uncharacterized protein n=2 Tax=Paracidovorax wautersii TaxID=1177982 RepID=A0A1I2HXQ3_9BURK|nr:hypothetical protein SAMN04489711_1474 [Paracidovorax wautersii]